MKGLLGRDLVWKEVYTEVVSTLKVFFNLINCIVGISENDLGLGGGKSRV